MKTMELAGRYVSGANAPQTIQIDTHNVEEVLIWGIQSAAGVATFSLAFVDSSGVTHNIYANAAALANAEPGTVVGLFSRGDSGHVAANQQFGVPPPVIQISATAAGAGLTTTFEIYVTRDVEADP